MKKILFSLVVGLATSTFVSCSKNGVEIEELITLSDCPHEDDEIDTKEFQGKGNVYIVDANFDGKKDIITGNEIQNKLFRWDKDKEKFVANKRINVSYPLFNLTRKVIYNAFLGTSSISYYKNVWVNDGQLEVVHNDEYLFEVSSLDGIQKNKKLSSNEQTVTKRYTVFKWNKGEGPVGYIEDVSCDDISELPDNWQRIISKIKEDYKIDDYFVQKQHEIDSIKEASIKAYPQACDDVWVDMGIESDDGQTLYWATSDLILRNDDTFGINNLGGFGSDFGWADATGMAKSDKDLDEYGGSNPPRSIVGNPEYDIVSAHLNSPARLPSKDEWVRLLENCDRTFKTIKRSEVYAGTDGLPAWAQGQWMAEAIIPQITGDALVSLSVKIDGDVCSVIATHGGQVTPIYEGVYDYHKPNLIMGGLTIVVNEDNSTMITESGHALNKVNTDTESSKIYGLMLTSNINGNKLFFPIPSPNVAVKSGKTAMEFQSTQENMYWSGTLSVENKACAYFFYIKGSNPTNVAIGYADRYAKKSVRAVTTTPITVSVGTAKNTEQ